MVCRLPFPSQSQTIERKTDAQKWAREMEARIEAGRFRDDSLARRHTVSDLIDAYLANVLPRRRDQRMPRVHMEQWRSLLGEYRLSELTPLRIIEARDKLRTDSDNTKSPATLNRYLSTLSKALSIAEKEYGWIETNPAMKVTKLPEGKGREVFLSKGEALRLLDACKQSRNKYLAPIVLLAMSTGMRRGEIESLLWSDVDLDQGIVIIRDSKNGER